MHHENGVAHYKLGVNEYSDLPPEDFMDMMNGVKAEKKCEFNRVFFFIEHIDYSYFNLFFDKLKCDRWR